MPVSAHSSRARWALGVAVVAVTALLAVPTVSADPIGDKRAEAERIASEVERLGTEIEVLAEEYNAATIHLQEIEAAVAAAEQKLATTQAELVARRDEVRAYAIEAYMRGEDTISVPLLGADDGTDVARITGYLRAAAGNREEVIDRLRATEEDVAAEQANLDDARAAAEDTAAVIAARRRGAEAAVAQQQQLYTQAQGELAELVRQEEERRAAERQAAAERAAAEAARQQAQAQSRRTSTGSGGSSGSSGGSAARPAPPSPAPAPPPAGDKAAIAVQTAYGQLGDPYVWGGSGPDGFDCSGLTMFAWKAAGVSVPHNSAMQYGATRRIEASQLAPGDLVFYGFSSIHHVAIYVGNGQIIHAPHAGDVVRVDSVHYWDDLRGYGRVAA
ncbi:MAG: NlpC/P60 family protein [Acidimicrobiales bacterium]